MYGERFLIFVWIIFLVFLPSCVSIKKSHKSLPKSVTVDLYNIDEVYKKQSLQEAAFSAIRRCIDYEYVDSSDEFIKRIEARYSDIPIPINVRPLRDYFEQDDAGDSCLAYDTELSMDEACAFYQREMEHFGWKQGVCFIKGYEAVLIYKKPQKVAVISLRPVSKRSSVGIRLIVHCLFADS